MPDCRLPRSLLAQGSVAFGSVLEAELLGLPRRCLPLDEVATPGAWVDDTRVGIRFLGAGTTSPGDEDAASIRARVGVFFSETIGNCGCGDEPYDQNGYAELALRIDIQSARLTFDPV